MNSISIPLASIDGTSLLNPQSDRHQWYLKAGLRERWTHLGHTVLYGEYGKREGMLDPTAIMQVAGDTLVANAIQNTGHFTRLTDSETRQWGFGAVQEIDAAAMSMWLSYKHFEGSVDTQDCIADASPGFSCSGTGGKIDFKDFQLVKFGALINF